MTERRTLFLKDSFVPGRLFEENVEFIQRIVDMRTRQGRPITLTQWRDSMAEGTPPLPGVVDA